jgi:type II secretory pathway component PulC
MKTSKEKLRKIMKKSVELEKHGDTKKQALKKAWHDEKK